MAGVRYLEELQALQAANSPKGNQPMKVKPTRGRFKSSRFQKDMYRSILAGSFPNAAFDIGISLFAQELDAVLAFIAQNNPQAAEEIVEKMMDAVRMLASFPQMGKQTVGQSPIFISVGSDCS